VIFVDSNVPMYLVGKAHVNKERSTTLLEEAVTRGERLVIDAEVVQEILHRYAALDRRDAVQPAYEAILALVDDVFPIELSDVVAVKDALLGGFGFSARDCIHIAVVRRHGVQRIMSFDADFDQYPGIARIA
jgi:predicted nucleic acid-binding protein